MFTKRYIFLAFSVLLTIYLIGISTGHYKHFPFNLMFSFKKQFTSISESKRNVDIERLKAIHVTVDTTTGIYITYGQSNAANHGQIGYEVENEVYQYFKGKTYVYKDPSLGVTGGNGSVWGMLGDKLISSKVHEKVIFSNNGFGGRAIDNLNKKPYLNYLIRNYKQLIKDFGRVDAILFHQGEINHSNKYGNTNYYNDFEFLVNSLSSQDIEIPIYLSRTSICGNLSDPELIKIQNRIIEKMDLVLPGPQTDLLSDPKYRLPDNCHFSLLGYDKFSDMWVESLRVQTN